MAIPKAKLQVALDFVVLDRALAAAREAVAGGADILEAGTLLIKSEGLNAIRALRAEFPDAYIVADTKTMDVGRDEMEAAAKAGANCAAVMGLASPATIRECIEAGKHYGVDIMVDLLGVPDPVKKAQEAEEWGADVIGVHVSVDEQMLGQSPFAALKSVVEKVGIPVAVAGGINSESAPEAVKSGASIVIVGGAITKDPDARRATEAIKRAIETGRPESTSLYKRSGEGDIRNLFERVSTANLSDALHRQASLPGIRPVVAGAKLVGTAITVRTYPGDWAKPVEAIDRALPGQVVVVDAGGVPPAVWGELATESAIRKKLAGVVVDGAVRDSEEIRKLLFPAFSRHVSSNAGEPKGFGEIGVPVVVAGQRASPGDWVVGDDDGVVIVPREKAVEYANRAMDVLEKENRLREEIRRGGSLAGVAQLLRWEKAR